MGAWFSPSITSIAFRKRSLRSCRSGSDGMKEGGDNVFGVGGMALVIAGSLSLFRLTRSEKSAFHMARLVELPVASPGGVPRASRPGAAGDRLGRQR